MTGSKLERRRILSAIEHDTHRNSMLLLRDRAHRWANALPERDRDATTAAISRACTTRDLRLAIEGW